MTFNEIMAERRAEKRAARQARAAADPIPRVARRAKRQRKPKPLRRVDLLAVIPELAARPARLLAMTRGLTPPRTSAREPVADAIFQTKGRPAVRGAAAIVRRFEKLGVTFELGPDGGLIARTEGGTMFDGVAAALDIIAPLVTAHLAGQPLACAWHDGREAVTLLLPGRTPACAEHAELSDDGTTVETGRIGMSLTDWAPQIAARLRGH